MGFMLVLLVVIVFLLLYGVSVYNKLVKLRTMVEEAWSGINVQLKKQHGAVLSEGRNLKFHLLPWLEFIVYLILIGWFAADDLLQFATNRNALVATLLLGLVSYLLLLCNLSPINPRGTGGVM